MVAVQVITVHAIPFINRVL